ncbi:MAG: DUF1330 domain-containing protein [Burkholderiales bacterium]
MAAYLIADVEVIDSAGYADYQKQAPGTIALYGGRYLARGGATEVLEGSWSPKRCVILEFPTMPNLRPGMRLPSTNRFKPYVNGPQDRILLLPRGSDKNRAP